MHHRGTGKNKFMSGRQLRGGGKSRRNEPSECDACMAMRAQVKRGREVNKDLRMQAQQREHEVSWNFERRGVNSAFDHYT